jgi:hypothetical protein
LSRVRAAGVAVTAATVLAARVPAEAVPVPPAGWTPFAGLLIVALIVATSAYAIRHHRNHRTTPEREEA